MNQEELYELLNHIPVTADNAGLMEEIRQELEKKHYAVALEKIEKLGKRKKKKLAVKSTEGNEEEEEEKNVVGMFPKELSNKKLERQYIGLLLTDPRYIIKYFYLFEECYFEDPELLNIYKSVIFTEGGAYSSELAKKGFNFSRDTEHVYELKTILKREVRNKNYNMEKIYIDLKKLFVLRRSFLAIPIQNIQDRVMEIKEYQLYDKMSVEEVENAVIQVNDTEKFKRAVLNEGLSSFLELGDNNLTNGLSLPFPVLTRCI